MLPFTIIETLYTKLYSLLGYISRSLKITLQKKDLLKIKVEGLLFLNIKVTFKVSNCETANYNNKFALQKLKINVVSSGLLKLT